MCAGLRLRLRLEDQRSETRRHPRPNLQSLNLPISKSSSSTTPAATARPLMLPHFPWVQVIASAHNLGFTGGKCRICGESESSSIFESGYGAGHRVTSQTSRESNVKRQTSNVRARGGRGAGHARRRAIYSINNPAITINNSSFSPSPLAPLYATQPPIPPSALPNHSCAMATGSPLQPSVMLPTPPRLFREHVAGAAGQPVGAGDASWQGGRPASRDADWLVETAHSAGVRH